MGEIEKYSETFQRNAVFKKTSKVNKLPSYLCVQFVRFYWKKESVVGGTKAGKAKILRSVAYPRVLDIYNFCSDELKKSLDFGREFEAKLRAEEDEARLQGKRLEAEGYDKEMKGNNIEESKEDREQKRLVGQALKKQQQEEALK